MRILQQRGHPCPLDSFLVYYNIDSTTKCGNSLNATSGWFGVYHLQTSTDEFADCVWSITGKETHRVVLVVLNLYIECDYNYLQVSAFFANPLPLRFTYLQLVVIFDRLGKYL